MAGLAYLLFETLAGYGSGSPSLDGVDAGQLRLGMAIQSVVLTVALAVVPTLWLAGTRVGGWPAAWGFLRLQDPTRGVKWGLLMALAALAGLLVLGHILEAAGVHDANPAAEAILAVMTLPLALLVATGAAIGEEVFFRGFLQRALELRLPRAAAVLAQAAVFGLFHAGYGNLLQLAIPAALGIIFGAHVASRRGTLWAVIVAHFVFDFVQFTSPMWLRALQPT